MKVTLTGPNLEKQVLELTDNISVEALLDGVRDQMPYPIYLCKLNNIYRGLAHEVHHDSVIEFLDIRNNAAWSAYQDSLILLYLKAVHDICGKQTAVTVRHSFNKGLYTSIDTELSDELVGKIEARMHELVAAALPITKKYYNRQEAIELAESMNQQETVELLKSIPSLKSVEIFSLEEEINIFYGLLVPNTSYLTLFELRPYQKGVLLRYPHPSDPNTIPEYEDQVLLYNAFKEANKWGDLLDINYVSELNRRITDQNTREMYLLQEALHEKKISDLADDICAKHRRLVLICGPSSSGKTTFAKRLCVQLKVNGYKTMYMGTDDYFVEDHQAPIDEDGERDYESIRAIDDRLFVANLKSLLAGEMTDLPEYSFITHTKTFGKHMTRIDNDVIIVIEGIHALNEVLTQGIDEDQKYKIYISPFTPIFVDQHNRISATDCRLLRRMVRDYQFRNWDCRETIEKWPKVRNGEDNNIFPFIGQADYFFNSNCIYEFAVIKKYAEPLLKGVTRSQKEYAEAQRLLSFLRFFETAQDDDLIVNHSIIREFIGGSSIVF